MRVLSLFDGISCARVALERAGIPVDEYLASEVDPHAIAISTKNYPDIVRLGDVREVRDVGAIDLLIGGSPCQDLSVAKKGRQGLEGSRSSLFWEYVRIWREVKPTWFVLENVASMPKADRDIITREMGVEPILIDAALVSAQSRKRLFWTNLPVVQPEDRGIVLRDILETEVDASYDVIGKAFTPSSGMRDMDISYVGHLDGGMRKGMEGQEALSRAHRQTHRVYGDEGKAPTLSASETSGRVHVAIGRDIGRRLNEEGRRADADTSLPYVRRVELREDGKSGTLTSVLKDNLVVGEARIRKLTPVECERLQGLPDGYTEGVARTHRYKALGNAFNVDVVAHICRSLRGRRGGGVASENG